VVDVVQLFRRSSQVRMLMMSFREPPTPVLVLVLFFKQKWKQKMDSTGSTLHEKLTLVMA
jgi:hypothetical protein